VCFLIWKNNKYLEYFSAGIGKEIYLVKKVEAIEHFGIGASGNDFDSPHLKESLLLNNC
jgi:hypothetical protein